MKSHVCDCGINADLMKTKLLILFLSLGGGYAYAGALDNPRIVFDHFPNVNVDAHVARITRWHFADIRDGAISTNATALKEAQRYLRLLKGK